MESYSIIDYLNENVTPYYTQMLIEKRIENNKVVYVFDEVGCGKTVSAIIAMTTLILNGTDVRILVITPKSVSNQFENEIKNKLKIKELNVDVKNLAFLNKNDINLEFKSQKNYIIVANKEKADILARISWNLVIIDEAHDIVCNNKKQAEVFWGNKIDKGYESFVNKINDSKNCKISNEVLEIMKLWKDYISALEKEANNEDYEIKYFKYLAINDYNKRIGDSNKILIEKHRQYETKVYGSISHLKSEKVMFLTATPYKNDKEIDFLNYALLASIIIPGQYPSLFDILPEMNEIKKIYSSQCSKDDFKKMETSNTSLFFKEITQEIPENIKDLNNKIIKAKNRNIEIWYEGKDNFSLFKKIRYILNKKVLNNPNRILIFVSNSNEGKIIFNRIFPHCSEDITNSNTNHIYEHNNIKCEFIMNKFGNSLNLNKYAIESENIPNILIVTYQSAQVGINLPTFNYVINYHIPSIPGYLEQRYGRIDRLKSQYNTLNNIYYLDNELSTSIYRINLIQSLYRFKAEIFYTPHNLPVKNLLLCDGLNFEKENVKILYNNLAYYIWYYLIGKSEDEIKKFIENNLKNTCWEKAKLILNSEPKQLIIIKDDLKEKFNIQDNIIKQIENQFCDEIENNNSQLEGNKKISITNDDIKEKINEITECILSVNDINEKIDKLNNKDTQNELKECGSIIFYDNTGKRVTINCEDIVKKIIKLRSN